MTEQSSIFRTSNLTALSPAHLNRTPVAQFEIWVDRFPESVAITGSEGILTYLQVEQRANQIAHALSSAGVQKGDMVTVFLHRGPDLVCALLGVLKAGAVFVSLDPRTPGKALAGVLSSVDCAFVWSRRSLVSFLPRTSSRILLYDEPGWIESQPVTRIEPPAGPDEAACVLFTSGSDGHSKAVLYLHRNLAVRFATTLHLSGFDQFSIFAQSSPVTSIDAIDEMFLPLVSGGSTAILPYETVTSPHQLIDSLSAFQVTHILLVPSLLRVILAAEENLAEKMARLRTWMIGGEPLMASLAQQFFQQIPGATLINFYGLTEGDACFHMVSPASPYDLRVPIGSPVPDTGVYLLDETLNPVPMGEPGEICLSGEGLFHEYLNCPELNARRWSSNPFAANVSEARLFHTGDMGRLRADGEMEYLGRRDRNVQIRGFRVELSDVETILSRHPAVDQCVLVARQSTGNGGTQPKHQTYIVAYAILKRGERASSHDLRDFLKDHLPEYAVPAMVTVLDEFPLSPNGKVDLQAL